MVGDYGAAGVSGFKFNKFCIWTFDGLGLPMDRCNLPWLQDLFCIDFFLNMLGSWTVFHS
jgi:hypothetical protein